MTSFVTIATLHLCLLFTSLVVSQTEPGATDAIPVYSPARPPAVPLAVRSPYTNAWSSTAGGNALNRESVIFWNGESLGWNGVITVDGISYQYLGTGFQLFSYRNNITRASPKTVEYDSQWSNFTFIAGEVQVLASFFSPVLPQDLCRTSIPLSYLQTTFTSLDGNEHDVKLYSDVNAAWLGPGEMNVEWGLEETCFDCGPQGNGGPSPYFVASWIVSTIEQNPFAESDKDFPQWGSLVYSSAPGTAWPFTWQSGYAGALRDQYLTNYTLSGPPDHSWRSYLDSEPVFAFTHDFGTRVNGSALYTVGTVQQPAAQYLTSGGLANLQPWWMSCYGSLLKMINFHYLDFATASAKAGAFEATLQQDVANYYQSNSTPIPAPGSQPLYSNLSQPFATGTSQSGQQYFFDGTTGYGYLGPDNYTAIAVPNVSEAQSYYAIVALSARQVMGAYILTEPPPLACNASLATNQSEPFMFQKEISSNGNMNTVDVIYPAMPFFLYTNPELLKYLVEPLYLYQEAGFYPNGAAVHDLGSNFPVGIGHLEGTDEQMPVEECGNMLILAYAYYKFSGNVDFLRKHYPKLQQWTVYLNESSLIPELQISTDDFAGALVNQTNLALKGIIGLKAMALINEAVGNSTAATYWENVSQQYFEQWTHYGIDPAGKHALLAYQLRSSWGLLYNTYPDKLLNLGLIPDEIYDMQSEWYPKVAQAFGVPLDSRASYTKSDWEMWTAATCSPETRRLFVNALAYWLNNTSTSLAFTDLYETIGTGDWASVAKFIARPVVGGHFSFLALLKAGENGDSGTSDTGSHFDEGETNALTEQVAHYATASASEDTAILSALSTLTESVGDFTGTVSSHSEAPTILDTTGSSWMTSSTTTRG